MVIVTWARPQSLALPHWRIQFSFKLSLSSLPLDSTPGPSLQDGSSQHHQKDQTQGKGDADSHGVSIILWFQPFYFSHGPSKCIRLFILGFRCSLCSLSALKDSHYRVLGSQSWFFCFLVGQWCDNLGAWTIQVRQRLCWRSMGRTPVSSAPPLASTSRPSSIKSKYVFLSLYLVITL